MITGLWRTQVKGIGTKERDWSSKASLQMACDMCDVRNKPYGCVRKQRLEGNHEGNAQVRDLFREEQGGHCW